MENSVNDSSSVPPLMDYKPMQLISFFAKEGGHATEILQKIFNVGFIEYYSEWQKRFFILQLFFRFARGMQIGKMLEIPFFDFIPSDAQFYKVTGIVGNLPVDANFENGGTYYFIPNGITSSVIFLELCPALDVEELRNFVQSGGGDTSISRTVIEDVGLFDIWSEEFGNIDVIWSRNSVVINDPHECIILDVQW